MVRNYSCSLLISNNYVKITLLLMFVILLGRHLIKHEPNLGGLHWRHSQEDNVYEAVFRWQIQENRNDQTCFLSLGKDRDVASVSNFMLRFQNCNFVKPLYKDNINVNSPIKMSVHNGLRSFIDMQTGKPSLHFWVDKIQWYSDVEVHVDGGGAAADLSGDFGTIVVHWQNSRWKVIGYQIKGSM